MRFYWSLLWAEARSNPGRLLPGLLAMCVSVVLVIWMMGSYDHLASEFDHEANAYMGSYDLSIIPLTDDGDEGSEGVSDDVIDSLPKDSFVEAVDSCRQIRLQIGRDRDGMSFDDYIKSRMGIPSQSPVLVGSDASVSPYQLEEGIWPDMMREVAFVGVLGSASAGFFGVKTGDVLKIRNGARVVEVTVVGIVHQAEAFPDIAQDLKQGKGPALSSLFVPKRVFEAIEGVSFRPNLLNVRLREGVSVEQFKTRVRANPLFERVDFADTDVLQHRLENNRSMRRMKDSAQAAVGMVLFACVFIIFTTLSMGVTDRVRKFSLMRALGIRKKQIAGLIVGESLLLSIPAFLIGCLAGFLLLILLQPDMGGRLPMPSAGTLLIAFACSSGGALLASIIPAWRATRSLPLEAFGISVQKAKTPHTAALCLAGMTGVLCWLVQPGILFVPGLEPETRKMLFTWLGYPALLIGTVAVTPCVVLLVEKVLSRALAFAMRVNPAFLKMSLLANLTRTTGTAISLTVGLGIYMAVQIWGYSMVVPFLPDSTMPDTLVSFLHTEVDGEDREGRRIDRDLREKGLHPILVEEPDIAPEQLSSPNFKTIQQSSIVVAGVDVDSFMGKENAPLIPEFVDGEEPSALAMLKTERALLIPDTFAHATGLKTGDVLKLVHPEKRDDIQDWKVAGVVHLPGWHWITKTSGMRVRRGHFIAALAIADKCLIRRSFGTEGGFFYWGDLSSTMNHGQLQAQLQDRLDAVGESSELKPLVKVTSNRALERRVGQMADRTISAMSKLPLIALLIGSLALMNTVFAGVNARRKEFRLMHAVGVTRQTLFRIVLSESIMTGAVAVMVSLLFALVASWSSIQVLKYGYIFGSVTPPLSIPWLHLLYGVLITLGLCFVPLLLVRLKEKSS